MAPNPKGPSPPRENVTPPQQQPLLSLRSRPRYPTPQEIDSFKKLVRNLTAHISPAIPLNKTSSSPSPKTTLPSTTGTPRAAIIAGDRHLLLLLERLANACTDRMLESTEMAEQLLAAALIRRS